MMCKCGGNEGIVSKEDVKLFKELICMLSPSGVDKINRYIASLLETQEAEESSY